MNTLENTLKQVKSFCKTSGQKKSFDGLVRSFSKKKIGEGGLKKVLYKRNKYFAAVVDLFGGIDNIQGSNLEVEDLDHGDWYLPMPGSQSEVDSAMDNLQQYQPGDTLSPKTYYMVVIDPDLD